MTDESTDGRTADPADVEQSSEDETERGSDADATDRTDADATDRTDADATTSGATASRTADASESAAEAAERESAGDDGESTDATTDGESARAGTDEEPADGDDLEERVATYDEDLAAEVADLRARVEELEDAAERRDDLEERLKRTRADFQNYKKRAKKKQAQIRERATEGFVERVVTVRDNLVRALDQDEDADIRPGVESTLEEFDRILAEEDVTPIDPEPGTDVDPTRHEVMMRVDSDQPEGTVADVYQPGYEMAEKVVREAQVTVSTGDAE